MSVLSAVALPWALRIVVEGSCPALATVESRIRELDSSVLSREATARLEPLDDRLRVEVRSGTGALLVVEDLVLGPSCDTLAAAAAIVIASSLGSSRGTDLPLYGPIVIPLPVLPKYKPPPPRAHLVEAELGVAASLEAAWPRPGGGGFVWGQLAPSQGKWSRLGAVWMVGGTSLKQQALLGGSIDYTRLKFSVGPRVRLAVRSWLFDVFATVSPSLVLVYGRDFPATYRSQDFDLGLGGGVRAMAKLGSLSPFVVLSGTGFVREQRLVVLGAESFASLAPYTFELGLGLSWLALP